MASISLAVREPLSIYKSHHHCWFMGLNIYKFDLLQLQCILFCKAKDSVANNVVTLLGFSCSHVNVVVW